MIGYIVKKEKGGPPLRGDPFDCYKQEDYKARYQYEEHKGGCRVAEDVQKSSELTAHITQCTTESVVRHRVITYYTVHHIDSLKALQAFLDP